MTSATSTTAGARAHARAQGGTLVTTMPTVPARSATAPEGVEPSALTWVETVAGGGYASRIVSAGTTIRLTDIIGDSCAHLVLFNALGTHERLNIADTVKVLWQAYVTTGHPLLSDQGRVLATVTADTSGRSDSFCGTSTRIRNQARYGDGAPEGPSPAGRELLTLAAAKQGLSRRDLPPSISFFQGVRVDVQGAFEFLGSAGAGRFVELRAELPLVVLLAVVPHPLDPRPDYSCGPLQVMAWRGSPTAPEDPLWSAGPEATRAFLNTADYRDARRPA